MTYAHHYSDRYFSTFGIPPECHWQRYGLISTSGVVPQAFWLSQGAKHLLAMEVSPRVLYKGIW